MTSLAVENEIAYRRHDLERAASRDAVRRYRNDRSDVRAESTGRAHLSWWRRLVLAH